MSIQLKRLAFTVGATAVIQLSGVITGLIAARMLGPEGRGVLASIVSFASVAAALCALSLQEGVVYRVARAEDAMQRDRVLSAALTCLGVLVPLALLVGAGVATAVFDGAARAAALMFLINMPLNFLTLAIVAYFQAGGRHGLWSVLRTLPMGTAAVIALGFVMTGASVSVSSFLMATIAGNGLLLIVGVAALALTGFRPRRASAEDVRDVVGYGVRLHPAALAANARDHLDRILMTLMLPAAALGLYAAAATLAAALLLVGLTLDMAALPALSRLAGTDAFRTRFGQVARLAVAVIAAAAGALAAVSPLLVPFLFGEAFADAAILTALLAVAYGLAAIKTVIALGLKASNQPFRVGIVEAATLVLLLVAMPPLILILGPVGAAVGAAVAQGGSLALMVALAHRRLGIPVMDLLLPRLSDVAAIRTLFARTVQT